ncbi:hypothetical protein H0E87_001472 [Populus deltoides]|uniref:Clustered mitochondria protein n=1 Tax=Populus deltoides TaxID=3696 RepID=A0A8T2ZR29_POPDE|nr:hypothetical protein H0E87_001472 [Populus deltoides]
MAGKSNKGRNRRGSNNTTNSLEPVASSNAPVKDDITASEADVATLNEVSAGSESTNGSSEIKESETANPASEAKQGDLHLYPVSVKSQSGEKLELQLNPGDSVMDVRQFLLDAPETCFYTCYDLLLHTKDGSTHQLEDYNEISEVADITSGGCSLEMVTAPYDDRSIRAHVHHTRELLSLSTLHASLSTSLALEYETAQNKAPGSDTGKTEVPELDGMGFMEDVAGSVGKLLSFPTKEIKCVDSIVFSSFNPPPSHRRLVGDLIYLDAVTLEGNRYCVTGTIKMFYVNSSTGNVLDPRPSKATSEATTLVGLLQKISPTFKRAFRENLERKGSAHPFENVQSLLPPNSWLGLYPVPDGVPAKHGPPVIDFEEVSVGIFQVNYILVQSIVAQEVRGIIKEQRDEKRQLEEKRLDGGEGISSSESDQFLPLWKLFSFTSIRLFKLNSNNNQKK